MKVNSENTTSKEEKDLDTGSCSFCSDGAAQSCDLHDAVVPFCEFCSAEFQQGCITHEHE